MKTKGWILIFTGILCVCAVLAWRLSLSGESGSGLAGVYLNGELIQIVDSSAQEQEFQVGDGEEYNIIRAGDGEIRVIAASCHDGTCIRHGALGGGAPIVCLPNRLMIRWMEHPDYDAITGT